MWLPLSGWAREVPDTTDLRTSTSRASKPLGAGGVRRPCILMIAVDSRAVASAVIGPDGGVIGGPRAGICEVGLKVANRWPHDTAESIGSSNRLRVEGSAGGGSWAPRAARIIDSRGEST